MRSGHAGPARPCIAGPAWPCLAMPGQPGHAPPCQGRGGVARKSSPPWKRGVAVTKPEPGYVAGTHVMNTDADICSCERTDVWLPQDACPCSHTPNCRVSTALSPGTCMSAKVDSVGHPKVPDPPTHAAFWVRTMQMLHNIAPSTLYHDRAHVVESPARGRQETSPDVGFRQVSDRALTGHGRSPGATTDGSIDPY